MVGKPYFEKNLTILNDLCRLTYIAFLQGSRIVTNRYTDPLPFRRYIAYADNHPAACNSAARSLVWNCPNVLVVPPVGPAVPDSVSDLRGLLRSGAGDTDLASALAGIWGARSDRYSELRNSLPGAAAPRVEMSYIGG